MTGRPAPRWLRIVQAIFEPRWNLSHEADENLPDYDGWYRVMVSGDSESIDGFQIYAFDDYETWAFFTTHEDGGSFVGQHDEDNYVIYAWCGPFHIPPFVDPRG